MTAELAMFGALGALALLAAAAWICGKIRGPVTAADRAQVELDEIEREEFALKRTMLHDRHRLAFIRSRKTQLRAMLPPPKSSETNVRWLDRFRGYRFPAAGDEILGPFLTHESRL